MPFPARTQVSDALARAVHDYLTQANVGGNGKNRMMITVVTAGGTRDAPTHAYVAFSGALQGGTVRAALTNLAVDPQFGHFTTNLVNFDGAGQLAAAFNGPIAHAAGDYRVADERSCAEPRALLAATNDGNRPNGMSTIWWGNNANGYPHPGGGQPHNAGQTIFARPCDYCETNEHWIMSRAQTALDASRGLRPRMQESPF